MKMLRRLLCVLLIMILSASAMVACTGNDVSGTGNTESTEGTAAEVLDYPNAICEEEDKILVPLLPDDIFTTTAEENGLDGTVYKIYGTVLEYILDDAGNPAELRVDTLDGEVVISDPFYGLLETFSTEELGSIDQDKLRSFFPMPEVGEFARIFAEYQGMSNKYNAPFFIYGSNDYLTNALLECLSISETATGSTVPNATPTTSPSTSTSTNTAATDTTTVATESAATEPTAAPTTSGVTTGQANALKEAKSYLSIMAFSRAGLIKQLEYEGYSSEEAAYGADNCGADWNAQAIKQAKSYLNTAAFSYSGLVSQLEYEGFTNSQAVNGVDNCGADWNAQAAKAAASYLNLMPFSRSSLIDQLKYEGYTHDQAVYGADSVGLT